MQGTAPESIEKTVHATYRASDTRSLSTGVSASSAWSASACDIDDVIDGPVVVFMENLVSETKQGL